jgi:hypothetical protein
MATHIATNMIAQGLIPEFEQEMAATRKVLENVPETKLSWQPHDKSMTLSRLAAHVAEIPGFSRRWMTTRRREGRSSRPRVTRRS